MSKAAKLAKTSGTRALISQNTPVHDEVSTGDLSELPTDDILESADDCTTSSESHEDSGPVAGATTLIHPAPKATKNSRVQDHRHSR